MNTTPQKTELDPEAYSRKIPFFNYGALFTRFEDDFMRIFQDVGRRGAFIMQKDMEDFEEAVKEANRSSDRILWIRAVTQSGRLRSAVVELDEK